MPDALSGLLTPSRRAAPAASVAAVPPSPRPVLRRFAWAAAGAAAAATVWLVAAGAPPVREPEPGPWSVLVAAGHRDLAPCTGDPAVAHALTAAVDPPAGTGVRLVEGATTDDFDRVVACLERHAGTALTVTGPER